MFPLLNGCRVSAAGGVKGPTMNPLLGVAHSAGVGFWWPTPTPKPSASAPSQEGSREKISA